MSLLGRLVRPLLSVPVWKTSSPVYRPITGFLQNNTFLQLPLIKPSTQNGMWLEPMRQFHAANSKLKYLDYRFRLPVHRCGLNIMIIKRRKMRKHKLVKFRRRFKSLLAKMKLKREIQKEKAFRVELLTMIREAESFDPREYALRKIAEAKNIAVEPSKEERLEKLKQLIRENRYQVDYVKPKHRRADV